MAGRRPRRRILHVIFRRSPFAKASRGCAPFRCATIPRCISALTNDEGFAHIFSEQLRSLMRPRDVLIGISVHGGSGADKAGAWSQNLLRAMQVAKEEFQATVVGFSGFDGGAFRHVADVCLTVPFPSTPQVESFHLALEHLITFCLKEKIANCP